MFDNLPQKNKVIELKPLVDKGGQRVIVERRFFQYGIFSPENRNRKNRRSGLDRRNRPRYFHCDKIINIDSDKPEEVLFKFFTAINSDNPIHPWEKVLSKSSSQRETMSVQKEDQPDIYSGLPEHWHLQDPFDEVYFSEVIKKEFDEKAYIIYCVDTYNTYRLTDDQKEMFESFDNSVLNNIRTNMYSRNEIVRRFKQISL